MGTWLDDCNLPECDHSCHVKVKSLLEDPVIKAELRTYVQSNKRAMNLEKLQKFTNKTMLLQELPNIARKSVTKRCQKD